MSTLHIVLWCIQLITAFATGCVAAEKNWLLAIALLGASFACIYARVVT